VQEIPQFYPVGENSLTVSFGNRISVGINSRITALKNIIEKNPFPGFVETVPAFSSLTVFYDLITVRKNFPEFPTAFEAVKSYLQKILPKSQNAGENESRLIEIEFCASDEFALDLEFISETKNLSKQEIIEIFTSVTYRVFMLGFLPGFAYMGEVDERIAASRKETPRLKVPKGSVGIAGNQTGIYPMESPGGWQIMGKTDVELFTPNEKKPAFLQVGDLVKFTAK
jgi:inhibitor of KinA